MAASKDILIEGVERTMVGKGNAHKLRKTGHIPAVLNHQGKSTLLAIDPKLLSKSWTQNEKKFTLTFKGQSRTVKITELQIQPVSRAALHVDLAYAD